MALWPFDRIMWRKSKHVSPNEGKVLKILLHGPGEYYLKLQRQVETAPYVERELREGDTIFHLSVPYTSEDLLIPLDENVRSRSLVVRDEKNASNLSFWVTSLRGGFFGYLEGRREDGGKWRRDWSLEGSLIDLDQNELDTFLTLPSAFSQAEMRATGIHSLGLWIGLPDLVECFSIHIVFLPPAQPDDIEDFVKREGVAPPVELRELWKISNGLRIGEQEFLGTRDARIWDGFSDPSKLLVIADLREDGLVGIFPDEQLNCTIHQVDIPGKGRENTVVLASSLRKYLIKLFRSLGGCPPQK